MLYLFIFNIPYKINYTLWAKYTIILNLLLIKNVCIYIMHTLQ